MNYRYLTFLLAVFCWQLSAQNGSPLPRHLTSDEKTQLFQQGTPDDIVLSGLTDPPSQPVRTMAEWEELQAILIAWNGPSSWLEILAEIVRASREECRVVISCNSQNTIVSAQNYLNAAGVDITSNVEFIVGLTDAIWIRDYGPNCVYVNGVDSLYMVDWKYNRPSRKRDDSLATTIAPYFSVPLYRTLLAPADLVNTGGNFMSDGLGTAFASKLVLNENATGNIYGVSAKTEDQVDALLNDYMGIKRYIKMDVLPYDGIHHIDMHMKLLDEETLLVGEYPDGESDGPQIEANIAYVLGNYKSVFGTPFKLIRVPMPSFYDNGTYPPYAGQSALYPTFANALFVNKTVLMPSYNSPLDAAAVDTFKKYLPGYRIFPIDCRNIIGSGGAIHCITKEVGVYDPLQIVHQPLPCMDNTLWPNGYPVWANLAHRSGIASASIYYATNPDGPWQSVDLPDYLMDDTTWTHKGYIPLQPAGTTVYYYIEATANSGKSIRRPMPAPEGWWQFCTLETVGVEAPSVAQLLDIYPNPASAITVIPVSASAGTWGQIQVFNALGQLVETVYSGNIPAGKTNYFIDAGRYTSGTYFVQLQTGEQSVLKKLVVK
ncbi:MAG: agmatine deiminase family protein [Saprospiraceae bacterium]|nr:agmatine deiminase family protein [Saprospiraceae bacterium]